MFFWMQDRKQYTEHIEEIKDNKDKKGENLLSIKQCIQFSVWE